MPLRHLREQIDRYLQARPAERPRLAEIRDQFAAEGPWTDRANMAGHAVATAIITNPAGELLLVHHRFHQVWWPPGGHLEDVDQTLADAALREAVEEAGINPALAVLVDPVPLDIAVTPVPANPAKAEGPHQHLDFRYLFTCPTVALHAQETEVHGAAWRPIADLDAPGLVAALRARRNAGTPV